MPPAAPDHPQSLPWRPFALIFTTISLVSVILILVSAPAWARLLTIAVGVVLLIGTLTVLLRRRGTARRDDSH